MHRTKTKDEVALEQWFMFAVRRDNKLTYPEGKAWAQVYCANAVERPLRKAA